MVLNLAHCMVIRDKRSYGVHSYLLVDHAIISNCQKFIGFIPITYQIDIRTARFLETFMTSDNSICMLFERQAEIGRNKIFSTYGRPNVHSVSDLRCAIDERFC